LLRAASEEGHALPHHRAAQGPTGSYRVGVVGHRYLSPVAARFAEERFLKVLDALCSVRAGVRAVTALAQGTDMIFADAALSLDIPIAFVSPYRGYEHDADHGRHRHFLMRVGPTVAERTVLPFAEPSSRAHLAAMEHVVETSHLLLIAWNGYHNAGLGATEHAIRRARCLGRPWLHVDVADLRVWAHVTTDSDAAGTRPPNGAAASLPWEGLE
jgi:hypothetical protein